MLKNKLLSAMGGEPSDPNFENVTMLLHGDGTNGGQNNTFLDASTNNFTMTRNGNTTQGSFSPYGPNWSNYFDVGSRGRLTWTFPSSAVQNAVSGTNYTIEFWAFRLPRSGTYQCIFSTENDRNNFLIDSSDNLLVTSNGGTSMYTLAANTYIPVNTWTHVALVCSGTTWTLYFNGVSAGTYSGASKTNYGTGTAQLGGRNDMDGCGYLSNFRVSTTARYSGAFTPSTNPFVADGSTAMLTCQSNRFIDTSTNNQALTPDSSPSVQRFSPFAPPAEYSTATIGGSGYFDGSGDYITAGTTSALAFGTGDFTTECWVYLTTNTSLQSIFNINQFNTGILVRYDNSSNGYALFLGGTQYNSGVTTVGQWVHLAAARASGTVRFFVNGVQTNSASNTFSVGNANFTAGTAAHSLSETMTGYISNFRAVNGTAVYTAAFTPPTAPVTAITNTQLLTNFTNAAIFDNAMMNDLETVGNAQISTSVKKFGTGSMLFDGSGDVLTAPMTPGLVLGTGDFTVEWWAYMTTVGTVSEETFLCTRGIGQGIQFTRRGSNWTLDLNSTAPSRATASGVLSNNNWIHLAATRQSGTIRLFTNGTLNATATGNTDNFAGTLLAIGSLNSNTDYNFNGYIDDLRITKGVARYTANFTPPTSALPTK
jgi:hypothetical protein